MPPPLTDADLRRLVDPPPRPAQPVTEVRRTPMDWRIIRTDGTVVRGFVSEDEARGYAYGRGWPVNPPASAAPAQADAARPAAPMPVATLRDQFAMAALDAILTATFVDCQADDCPVVSFEPMARDAYECADAMLAAREAKP